jgi:hypothetical protein
VRRYERAFAQPGHAAEQDLRVALDELRPACDVCVEALERAIVERDDVVLRSLDQKQPLELGELLRILLREVLRLRPIGIGVVELPDVVVEGALVRTDPRDAVPVTAVSLVVDAAVAGYLEVLRLAPLRGLASLNVQRARALEGPAARCSRSSARDPRGPRTVGAMSIT